MNLTKKALGLTLAVSVGFAAITFADDPGGSSKKSLESRIQELEAKLKDLGGNTGGGVKGSGIKISGYVDTSYLVNLGDADNAGPIAGGASDRAGGGAAPINAGRVFDSQFDSFNLNAVKLTIQKDKDTSKFPAGFRLDTIFGEDARVIKGGSNIGASTADDSEFAIEQAYINLGVPIGNGIDVKFGKMVTLLGFEVLESPANWQFSRSDAFRLAPMTQTGATFGYQWNDMFTTTVGLINGWDSTTSGAAGSGSTVFGSGNRNLNPGFVGRVDVSGPKTSVGDFNAFVAGFYANDVKTPTIVETAVATAATSNGGASYLWNIGGTWNKPFEVSQMTLGIDYLYRNDEVNTAAWAANIVTPYSSIDAGALSAYAKWDWNKYLTSSGRFSYSHFRNAIQYNAAGQSAASQSLSPLQIPFFADQDHQSDLFSFTLTQAFNVWKDTALRLEWRHDWTDSSDLGFGVASGVANSRDDIRQEQDTIAVNVVYSF